MLKLFVRQKSLFFGMGCLLGLWGSSALQPLWHQTPSQKSNIQVYFSPKGHCTKAILQAIAKANHSIFVMAYSFTSEEISQALVKAHQKGVDVKVLIDRSQIKGLKSQIPTLLKAGIPLWIDPAKGLAHNKVMILDKTWVLTGSFNFTKNAEKRNAENLLLIHDPRLAEIYTENWYQRLSMANPLLRINSR
jgi:phospholipase D